MRFTDWRNTNELSWHCCCVSEKSERAFTTKYQREWKKYGYNFDEAKVHTTYTEASGHFGIMPKSETTKLLVEQAVSQLIATSVSTCRTQARIQLLAPLLPEYPVFMDMFGVDPTLGLQLIAEIGDVCHFCSMKVLVSTLDWMLCKMILVM